MFPTFPRNDSYYPKILKFRRIRLTFYCKIRKDQKFDTMNVQCPDFYSFDSTTFVRTLINNIVHITFTNCTSLKEATLRHSEYQDKPIQLLVPIWKRERSWQIARSNSRHNTMLSQLIRSREQSDRCVHATHWRSPVGIVQVACTHRGLCLFRYVPTDSPLVSLLEAVGGPTESTAVATSIWRITQRESQSITMNAISSCSISRSRYSRTYSGSLVVFSRYVAGVVIDIITRAVGGRCDHLDLGIKRRELSSPPFLAIGLAASRNPSSHADACNHRLPWRTRGSFSLISFPLVAVSLVSNGTHFVHPASTIFKSSHFRFITTSRASVSRCCRRIDESSRFFCCALSCYTRKVSRLRNERNTRFHRRIIERTRIFLRPSRCVCIISSYIGLARYDQTSTMFYVRFVESCVCTSGV